MKICVCLYLHSTENDAWHWELLKSEEIVGDQGQVRHCMKLDTVRKKEKCYSALLEVHGFIVNF